MNIIKVLFKSMVVLLLFTQQKLIHLLVVHVTLLVFQLRVSNFFFFFAGLKFMYFNTSTVVNFVYSTTQTVWRLYLYYCNNTGAVIRFPYSRSTIIS